jgi:hypothetical protein
MEHQRDDHHHRHGHKIEACLLEKHIRKGDMKTKRSEIDERLSFRRHNKMMEMWY